MLSSTINAFKCSRYWGATEEIMPTKWRPSMVRLMRWGLPETPFGGCCACCCALTALLEKTQRSANWKLVPSSQRRRPRSRRIQLCNKPGDGKSHCNTRHCWTRKLWVSRPCPAGSHRPCHSRRRTCAPSLGAV
eukprot:6554795-Lingulodinium_polyedra.AAC.1